MLFEFTKKLLFANQLNMEKGSIEILGQKFILINAETLMEFLKVFPKGGKYIYLSAKESGKIVNQRFKSRLGVDRKKHEELAINFFELAGWGILRPVKLDYENNFFNFNLTNSNFAQTFGRFKEPVDHLVRGFLAGGASIIAGSDVDCLETSCSCQGKFSCNFVLAEKKYLKKEYSKISKMQL